MVISQALHSIPGSAAIQSAADRVRAQGMPLAMVQQGKEVHVNRIHAKEEVRRFLNNLGFVDGAAVTVVTELDGNVIVAVKGTRVAISKAMANKIYTE